MRHRPLCLSLTLLLAAWPTLALAEAGAPRPEHPRPDRMRADWKTLNGPWSFEFDDQDRGLAERWYAVERPFSRTITVPYAFQTRLSGIGETGFHDVVWYRRTLPVPDGWRSRRVMLHFGAVDYEATVWVNGIEAGRHRGGHTPFAFDVTDALRPGDNTVVVRAFDPSADRMLPRGKQYWKPRSEAIWYTRTSGIWQPVWLEAVHPVHVADFRVTPDVDQSQVTVEAILSRVTPDLRLRVTTHFGDETPIEAETACRQARATVVLKLPGQRLWSPERPNLYDLTLELVAGGQAVDRVDSYFGQGKVAVHDDRVYLNNAPYYLRLVLDQGYWPESTLTPPSEEAILMTEFGGIAYRLDKPAAQNEWGYSGIEPTKEAFLARLDGLVKAIRANPAFAGFCYTQLTDVEQEINGLLTYDRRPKADPAELGRIIGQ